MLVRRIILFGLLAVRLGAWELPHGWETQAPTQEQINVALDVAEHEGWVAVTPALRDGTLRAYEQGRTDAAAAWLGLTRWAQLLEEREDRFVPRWMTAINAEKVGHANMPRRYFPPATLLGAHVSRPLAQWLLANRRFTDKFFELLSPCDYLPAVLTILDQLFTADPKHFQTYAQLALAIAVVYDLPPPPDWPHAQVSQAALPRRLPAPLEAFAFFTKADETGHTLHKLSQLDADTLKFVVDVAAPFPELLWAQEVISDPLKNLAKTYSAVSYRRDREQSNQYQWPDLTYDLPHILGEGGICVDQAYFATEVGKARGVPTIFFHGDGNDARHAWFGYLDSRKQWVLDAGRYEEQNLVTGIARDPQTWGNLSDHELAFLSDGFRALPAYASSRVHAGIAAIYLSVQKAPEALAAARQAVRFERRNLDAWEILLSAQATLTNDPKTREGVLREAANAFDRYPDLNSQFRLQIADSLRRRGETSAADQEERQLARRNQGNRTDLTTAEAALILQRAMTEKPLAEQLQVYNQLVRQYGRDGGTGFYDEVTRPFVTNLVREGHQSEALIALNQARQALQPEFGSQLDLEMNKLATTLQ